ncbi:NAD-dependent epimerase/dehydratase family protein [Planctomicrobium sp. SH527]|uniref:NAD-dependent epimerase/dehydratase family protein n=1 Tax=Planctomicrobium sp. SH527 TaxID=3448123 RepID=UPI003F5BE39D
MSQTAFVTGGAGFLGRRLILDLVGRGLNVRCLVRRSTDLTELNSLLNDEQSARIQFVYGDVADRASLDEALQGADVVYHLAAALAGSPSTMFANTVIPTRTLLEASAMAMVKRFVLVSSLGVYGTNQIRRWGTLDESTPVDPHPELRDPYTFSKIRQEEVAWEAREKWGLPIVVVRPGVIYGPGRPLLTSRVGLSFGPVLLRMGGGHRLPYTYVENCAKAIALAGVTPEIEGEIFNVVDDDLPSGKQIVRLLKKNGHRLRSVWVPRPMIGPMSSLYEMYSKWSGGQLPAVITRYKSDAIWKPVRYSNEKAKRCLKWTPTAKTLDALAKSV